MKIEIFKAGKHTDSDGKEREWTPQDITAIAAKYNEQKEHEAPVVIGHPKDNAPAYGWAGKLVVEGKKLFAELKDMAPEFVEWHKKGLYKKRSISLYPDLTLKHIGFLGAVPPAVKGLENFQFAAAEGAVCYEFSDWRVTTIGQVLGKLRDYLIEKEGVEKADTIIPPYEIDYLKTPPPEPQEVPEPANSFKEEEPNMDKVQELEAKLKETEKQFAESSEAQKAKDTEIQQLKAQLAAQQAKTRKAEFSEYLDTINQPKVKVTPAMKPAVMDFMEILSGSGEFEFAEAEGKTAKKQPLEAFKQFLNALPAVVNFEEKATKKDAPDAAAAPRRESNSGFAVDPERQELHEKALAFQEKHPNTSYEVAINAVMNS